MKTVRCLAAIQLLGILLCLAVLPNRAEAAGADYVIRTWQVKWIANDASAYASSPPESGTWLTVSADNPLTDIPQGYSGMWVRAALPATMDWEHPGLLVDRLYGLELSVYRANKLLYQSRRDFTFDLNKLVLPVDRYADQSEVYIRILTTSDRAGLISGIRVGDFEGLSQRYVKRELPDLLLGTSIAFLAGIMLICSGYLNRKQRRSWVSLCLIALTTGSLIAAYSPLPYIYFRQYGNALLLLFDISLFVLFPSLNYYIDQMFEGRYRFYTVFGHIQAGYSVFCFIVMAVYKAVGEPFAAVYDLFTILLFGVLVLVQLLLIIMLSIRHAVHGNRNAVILSVGLFVLALSGAADLTIYYLSDKRYVLLLWKFGVVFMMVALVVILARRIMADHATIVSYSRELEQYNTRIQRTEKMKIISDLAASVAHEVRNPLQVTRGFLQLLSERSDEHNKLHFGMAINELDRASTIITDFLTFAKPEMDSFVPLDLTEEIRKIEAIMTPMASLHGGVLRIDIRDKLYIQGNASKFKQALINFIKNSIEAIPMDGHIEIQAYAQEKEAVIHIRDNGEGMEETELAKLGEPFFSTKSKGTGLGLMVTFRIVEAMRGSIEFRSAKGKGTEVITRFPLLTQDESLPDAVRA